MDPGWSGRETIEWTDSTAASTAASTAWRTATVDSPAHDGRLYGQLSDGKCNATESNGFPAYGQPNGTHDGHDGPLQRCPAHECK